MKKKDEDALFFEDDWFRDNTDEVKGEEASVFAHEVGRSGNRKKNSRSKSKNKGRK